MKRFLLAVAMLSSLAGIAQSDDLVLNYVTGHSGFSLKSYDENVVRFSAFWSDNYDQEPLGGKVSSKMRGGVQGVVIQWPKDRNGRQVDSISVSVIKKGKSGAVIGNEKFTVLREGFLTDCGCDKETDTDLR